jgi:hypothetical protein
LIIGTHQVTSILNAIFQRSSGGRIAALISETFVKRHVAEAAFVQERRRSHQTEVSSVEYVDEQNRADQSEI